MTTNVRTSSNVHDILLLINHTKITLVVKLDHQFPVRHDPHPSTLQVCLVFLRDFDGCAVEQGPAIRACLWLGRIGGDTISIGRVHGASVTYFMAGINEFLIYSLHLNFDLQTVPVHAFGFAKVHLGMDDSILGFRCFTKLIRYHLDGGEQTCYSGTQS